MYETYFGLATKPFAMTPDPRFLFPSRQHAMALTMLEYGLEAQAPLLLLTGDIGSGKTTLIRRLLGDVRERLAVGLISNTHNRMNSMLGWTMSALNIAPADDSEIALYEALVDCCVREYGRGRRTLLIVDEAQNLSAEVLEELRLLSNINSDQDLVLQILLVGQPELRATLARPALRQLSQRVAADFHLLPLSREDTGGYIRHRVGVAGGPTALFQQDAIEMIHARTGGIPRLVNQLCDYALVYAYSDQRARVDAEIVGQVLRDRQLAGALDLFRGVEAAPGAVPLRAP
jgi:general secretion pathway protein A